MNYKKAYFYMFNEMTDLITQIKKVQSMGEEICIADGTDDECEADETGT